MSSPTTDSLVEASREITREPGTPYFEVLVTGLVMSTAYAHKIVTDDPPTPSVVKVIDQPPPG